MAKRKITQIESDLKSAKVEKEAIESKLKDFAYEVTKAEEAVDVDKLKELNDEIALANKELKKADEAIKEFSIERTELRAEVKALKNMTDEQSEEIRGSEDKLKNLLSSEMYAKAFEKAVKSGNYNEVNSLAKTYTTEKPGAGVFVPTILSDMWIEAQKSGGRIFNLCRKMSVKGLYEMPVVGTRSGAAQQEEGAGAGAEQTGEFSSVTIKPKFINKWATTTDELEALSGTEFLTYLGEELFEEILKEADKKILIGSQTDGLKGITTTPVSFVPVGNFSGEMTWEKTLTPMALVSDGTEDNAVYVMNRKTFYNNIMTLSGTDNKPIYQVIQDNVTGKPQFYVNGTKVIFTNALKAFDDALDTDPVMVYGDFNQYLINTPKGSNVDVLRDPYSMAEDNMTKYVGKLYAGGAVKGIESFVVMTKGTVA